MIRIFFLYLFWFYSSEIHLFVGIFQFIFFFVSDFCVDSCARLDFTVMWLAALMQKSALSTVENVCNSYESIPNYAYHKAHSISLFAGNKNIFVVIALRFSRSCQYIYSVAKSKWLSPKTYSKKKKNRITRKDNTNKQSNRHTHNECWMRENVMHVSAQKLLIVV